MSCRQYVPGGVGAAREKTPTPVHQPFSNEGIDVFSVSNLAGGHMWRTYLEKRVLRENWILALACTCCSPRRGASIEPLISIISRNGE